MAVYSKAEASSLIRRAHTAEQYRMLASYFKARQTSFEAQAQAEKQEWERLSQNTTGNSKVPQASRLIKKPVSVLHL